MKQVEGKKSSGQHSWSGLPSAWFIVELKQNCLAHSHTKIQWRCGLEGSKVCSRPLLLGGTCVFGLRRCWVSTWEARCCPRTRAQTPRIPAHLASSFQPEQQTHSEYSAHWRLGGQRKSSPMSPLMLLGRWGQGGVVGTRAHLWPIGKESPNCSFPYGIPLDFKMKNRVSLWIL